MCQASLYVDKGLVKIDPPCSSQNLAKVISFVRQSAVVHLLNIVIITIPYIKLFSDIVYYQNVINVITKPSNWRSRASKNKSNVSSNGYYGTTWMGWKWPQAGCRCWAGAKLWRTPGSLHTNVIKVNFLIFKIARVILWRSDLSTQRFYPCAC